MTDSWGEKARELRRRAEARVAALKRATGPLSRAHVERLVHDLQVHEAEVEMQNEELRRIQEELRASKDAYFDLFDRAPVGYFILNLHGLVLEVNRAGAIMLDLTHSELRNRRLSQFVHPDHLQLYQTCFHRVVEDLTSQDWTVQMLTATGSGLWARCHATPQENRGSVGVLLVVSNITEARRTQALLTRWHKLEAVGVLAGGIAHDFNNLLTGVQGNLSLLSREPADPEAPELLKEAMEACIRARNLAQQLLTFSSGGNPVLTSVELPALVQQVCRCSTRGSEVKCDFQLKQLRGVQVQADPDQLGQVIQNLIFNAVQAMPAGGTIRVGGERRAALDMENAGLPCAEYAFVSIRDSGGGIEPRALGRLFEPYFTTKPGGKGLGLATSHSIVRAHGGDLRVDSTLGVGTCFTFCLPVPRQADEGVDEPPPTPLAVSSRSRRILVMDDDRAIARVLSRMLKRLGHDADVTEDGKQALEAYARARAEGRPYEAAILDLTIPAGMGGLETLKSLREQDSAVTAIVSSGYCAESSLSEWITLGFAAVLKKPYTMDHLAKALAQALGPD